MAQQNIQRRRIAGSQPASPSTQQGTLHHAVNVERSAQPRLPFELVHALVNEWDPSGVADLVDDEYDCLEGPLVRMIIRGASRAEFSEFLWDELQDHFGLDPTNYGVDAFADRLAQIARAAQAPPEAQDHQTEVIRASGRGRRNDPTGARWRCSCGSSSGGRWYASTEEALKAATRHTDST